MGFHITAVDPFYIKIPAVENIASGQQDSLVVRISTDAAGVTGWGESDCSPLVGLAVYVVPRSHTLISSIQYSLIGEYVGGPADVVRLHAKVLGRDLMDVQQAEHAYSGADIALWDALGKHLNRPVFELLHEQFESGPPPPPAPKRPYASVLFQDTPAQTQALAESLRRMKYSAVKFGWGVFGDSLELDIALVRAARAGLGPTATLCVDAGCSWSTAEDALLRGAAFAEFGVEWIEEPTLQENIGVYAQICAGMEGAAVRIAGGEASDTVRMAEDFIVHGGAHFIQIDVGRIGGLTSAYRVRQLAEQHGRVFVNHTFKSHLSIAAALHVMATSTTSELMEFPQGETAISANLVTNPLKRGADGLVRVPESASGLGVDINEEVLKQHLVPLRIDTGVSHAFNDAAPGLSLLYSTESLLSPPSASGSPPSWDWEGVEVTHVKAGGGLSKPLLLLVTAGGYVGCGLFNIETATALGEVAAVVRGVNEPTDVLVRFVTTVSPAAEAIGVHVGMTGAQALDIMRARAPATPPAKL